MHAQHSQNLSRGAWRAPALGFLAAGAVLIVTFLLIYGSVAQLRDNDRWVAHSYEVLHSLGLTLSSARIAEAAQRGYLLTEDPQYLAPLAGALRDTAEYGAQTLRLTADNPVQSRRAHALTQALHARIDVLQESVALGRSGDIAAGRAIVANGAGSKLMDEAEAIARTLETEERRLLELRSTQSEHSAQIVLIAFASTAIINLALLGWLASAAAREWRLEKEAGDAQKRLNEELELRVTQRTTELSEANDVLQAFAHSVAHDLRTPLRSMQGFAVALAEDYGERLDDNGRHYTDRIVAGATRLDKLILDLLAYSRLTRSQIELQRINLEPLARRVVQEMDAEIRERGATVEIDRQLPAVMGHHATLEQILTNLISNAMKFTAPGTKPQVRLSARTTAHSTVRLSVRDNGIGIEPRHQERIFKVFERLHGPETFPGTGVGLAIVRKGAERMNGKAGLASQPGAGSEFWVELAACSSATFSRSVTSATSPSASML